ncbi:hypothetical protein G6M50_17260 [Agrobacterium rhizogenes]|nr:hypothetical protein [Rhizobium rhizogenes]NTJ79529.1 hypothetical protein [Rhizobium rhizogenes]
MAAQFRRAEILLYLDDPAAVGINMILMWLGLQAMSARGFTELWLNSASGDYALIITDRAKIRRIRDVSSVPIINVEDFKFHKQAVGLFQETQWWFDASGFISCVQCHLDLRNKNWRRSPKRHPGVTDFHAS